MARPGNNWKKLPDAEPELIWDITPILFKILQGLAQMSSRDGGEMRILMQNDFSARKKPGTWSVNQGLGVTVEYQTTNTYVITRPTGQTARTERHSPFQTISQLCELLAPFFRCDDVEMLPRVMPKVRAEIERLMDKTRMDFEREEKESRQGSQALHDSLFSRYTEVKPEPDKGDGRDG